MLVKKPLPVVEDTGMQAGQGVSTDEGKAKIQMLRSEEQRQKRRSGLQSQDKISGMGTGPLMFWIVHQSFKKLDTQFIPALYKIYVHVELS